MIALLTFLLAFCSFLDAAENTIEGQCWFRRAGNTAPIWSVPEGLAHTTVGEYFQLHYPASDPLFEDTDRNSVPDIIEKQNDVFQKSRHLIETQLGWKLPTTRLESNRPQLHAYFITAPDAFTGATTMGSAPVIVLNSESLMHKEFASYWIHQMTHAAQQRYKVDGDYWFYEATAGWMEGQFTGYSTATKKAHAFRHQHPHVPITDVTWHSALGASRLLEILARPYRDAIRQIWERWSYSRSENLMRIIDATLQINRAPDFISSMQSFFLLSRPSASLQENTMSVSLPPYSAVVLEGLAESSSGGVHLRFTPAASAKQYSASVIAYSLGDAQGNLVLKNNLTGSLEMPIPFSGLENFRLTIVNSSPAELKGSIDKSFDASIPAVVDAFHATPEQRGMQLEWKTSRENGVAFWNIYAVRDGRKERLNEYPIPATIQSNEVLHYLFFDASAAAAYYVLEAITESGLPSPLVTTDADR